METQQTIKPRFYWEPSVRWYIQSLYWSITKSMDNAYKIIRCDAVPPTETIGGNKLVQLCFKTVARWLSIAQDFCIQERYIPQILEPARIISKLRVDTPYTVDITGLVLCRSRTFYDRYYRDYVASVVLIIPELKTAMSLRSRASMLPDSLSGTYTFNSVQPLPLVNRIHPHFLSIQKSDQLIKLSELDFLKVNLKDLRMFGIASPALENFCEVESEQKNRRRLASVCLTAGILVLDPPYYIVLTHGEHSEKILLSRHLRQNLDEGALESMVGKPVRIIAAVWYGIRKDEYPEAIIIEPANDTDEIMVDSIVGHVRFRGSVKKEDILSNFGFIPTHPALVEKNENIEFSYGKPYNEFAAKFVRAKSEITGLRLSSGNSLVPSFWNLLDMEKITIRWVAGILRRRANVRDCLLYLFKRYDMYGSAGMLADDIKKLIREIGWEAEYRWLRWAGMVFDKKEYSNSKFVQIPFIVTKCLYEAMNETAKNKMENFLNIHRKDVVTLHQLLDVTGFPTSIVLSTLENFDTHKLKKYDQDGLVWIIENYQDEQTESNAAKALENVGSVILNCLTKFVHVLSTAKVVENLKQEGMNYYVVEKALKLLETKGKVEKQVDAGNEFWFYRWNARVIDLLSSAPNSTFTEEEIRQKCYFPFKTEISALKFEIVDLQKEHGTKVIEKKTSKENEETNLREILEKLKNDGLIEENPVGRWAIVTHDMKIKRERLIKEPIRTCIEQIKKLRKTFPMQTVSWFKEQAIYMLRSEYRTLDLDFEDISQDAEHVLLEAFKEPHERPKNK